MPVMFAPTEVYGAEDGTTVGGEDPLQKLLGNQNLMGFLEMLLGAGGRQGNPVADILAEQRQRAELQAQSGAGEYHAGMNPGGLFDAIASAASGQGVAMPRLDDGSRRMVRVPLDNWGGDPNQAAEFAQKFSGQASPYQEQITALMAKIMEGLGIQPQGTTQQAAPSAMRGDTSVVAAGAQAPAQIPDAGLDPNANANAVQFQAQQQAADQAESNAILDDVRQRIQRAGIKGSGQPAGPKYVGTYDPTRSKSEYGGPTKKAKSK